MFSIHKIGLVFETIKQMLQSFDLPPVDIIILITVRKDGMYRIDIQMLDTEHLHVPASTITGWLKDIESKEDN